MSKMCTEPMRHALNGPTMGTRWSALFFAQAGFDLEPVHAALQAAVDEVDAQMSTWKPDSDLMRLNAAPVGANDGLVSTASLVVGVAAAGSGRPEILIAGLAGLVAGAMSMAAGEYVSVSSQTDAEKADIARETRELRETPGAELDELTRIYVARGLDDGLARQVAIQLTEKDALGAHSRDELGISETVTAHPIQAALVSAATFAVGAVIPLIIAALVPSAQITLVVAVTTLIALSVLGGLGASVGGAGIVKGAVRVTFWGALAMGATAGVGMMFGVTVG